jgi:serine protease inhibitor
MKRIVLFVSAILMAMVSLAGNEPKTITLTDAERTLVEQNSDFAFNLFRKTRDTENHVISPLSITYALGMLNNGAEGVTREEISQVLAGGRQTGYADVATMNAFCRKMLTESALLDEDTRVAIANTIYFNGDRKDISLKTAFKEAAATYYDATPSVLSFSDEATLGIINQWATDKTDGMIRDLLKAEDMQDPNLVSFLLNAICFKGAWVHPFEEKNTHKTHFDNHQRTAMMMGQMNEFRYAENNLYQSVILPYGNGSYQMTLFLPKYGKTLDDVVDALNGTNWNTAEYKDYEVMLYMPRIETDTNQDLEEIMASLGMKNAFLSDGSHGFWDFCHFGENEDDSDPCWISLMRQKAHLNLDEKGTEAAAATVIGMVYTGMPSSYAEFIADRPFLYIISERSTGSIFFIGQYMGEPLQNVRHDISLSAEEKQLVESNNDFAFRLFREARDEKSSIMSPLSITYALGMLNNGAAGKTQQEINDVLGFGEAGADAINQFCRKMLTEAPSLDEETKAEIANTIYVNSHWNYELKEPFVEKAKQYYDATPEARDFYDSTTRDAINQWGSDHTHDMIKEILSKEEFETGKDFVSYLLNALYFKGAWENKFNPDNTKEESFNGGEAVPMMHIPGGADGTEYKYTENDLYQAAVLPYGNGAYQMTVFLPRQGKTIADVLDQIDGKNWQLQEGRSTILDLKLPRFETDTNINLIPVMKALGMSTAFTGNAEFPDFCNVPVRIGLMKQVAKIKVNEEGTEAAAITIIGTETTSIPTYEAIFHATRPFLYIISEQSTGSIFFIGQYMGNTTTDITSPQLQNQTKNGSLYNLAGQRLTNPPSRGIYIRDGKKVVIK